MEFEAVFYRSNLAVVKRRLAMEHYAEVYAKLKELARKGKRITYGEIGQMMGLAGGQAMAREVGKLLDDINRDEHNKGRPMISAVVVSKQCGTPGPGFYTLARGFRKLRGQSDLDELEFWLAEIRRVYSYWANN